MSSLSERIMKKGKVGGMAEDIMELPGGGIGELSGTLKKHSISQTDIEGQKTWLKAAARANSLESFEQTTGLVQT